MSSIPAAMYTTDDMYTGTLACSRAKLKEQLRTVTAFTDKSKSDKKTSVSTIHQLSCFIRKEQFLLKCNPNFPTPVNRVSALALKLTFQKKIQFQDLISKSVDARVNVWISTIWDVIDPENTKSAAEINILESARVMKLIA